MTQRFRVGGCERAGGGVVSGAHSPVVGGWVVWNDALSVLSSPHYEAGEIVKVTPKTVTTRSRLGSTFRRSISDTLWFGGEDQAKALLEKLTSSVGLMKDEVRRSKERHNERAQQLIAKATGEKQ